MSLILQPFKFCNSVDNLVGTPSGTGVFGTNFTANSSNSDGTAVTVLSALAFDVHQLVIAIGGISLASANSNCLLDVLVDPAGGTSWSPLIDDLVCGMTPIVGTASGPGNIYAFPIFIKAGSSIGVRARTAHTTNITTGRIVMWAYGNPSRPDMWWCGQKVESLGINAGSSKGTNVTPGNSGTYGSWATIGTSSARYGAVQFQMNGTDGSAVALGYYFQLGVGSTKLPGSPTIARTLTTSEVGALTGPGNPIWCDVPASTPWQIRATCSSTGAEVWNGAVYGVY